MVAVSIAQVLSGYDRGHRVLASGGDINDAERALVDRLSDLSGYLPLDTTFASYWTGYPCGRHYALACTWPDATAARSGTVLTHTLLVPKSALQEINDLVTLAAVLRRPTSAADREAYCAPLAFETPDDVRPSSRLLDERARSIAALWFGQPDRPVLWMEDADTFDVVRVLWRLLWPDARASLAFCTFALGVRKIEKRVFDFLALPPAARASFLELTRSPAWFDRGRLPDPGVRHFAAERWTNELLEAGAALFEPVLSLCREHSLSPPPAWRARDALRFLRLAQAPADPLNAARTRADLLFWLWPELPPGHPLSRSVLGELLHALPAAPIDRRPLRELRDFVARRAVTTLAAEDQPFATEVARALRNETSRRLQRNAATESELMELQQECGVDSWRAAILCAGVATMAKKATLASELLALSARAEEPAWVKEGLGLLPAAERAPAVISAAEKLDESHVRWLWRVVADTALSIGDLVLILAAGDALGEHEATIGRVMTLAREKGMDFTTLSQTVPAESVLEWVLLSEADDEWAVRTGEEAIRTLRMDLSALAERCTATMDAARGTARTPARIFAQVASTAAKSTVERALRERTALAERLVFLAIREGHPAAIILKEALSALADDVLWSEGFLGEVERAEQAAASRELVEWLLPNLVEALRRGALTPAFGARWLALPEARNHALRAQEAELFGECPRWARGEVLSSLSEAARESLSVRATSSAEWVAKLILPALQAATSTQLSEASANLAALLDAPMDADTRFALAAATLDAVRWTRVQGGHAFVERAFPVVYQVLVKDGPQPLPWYLRFWMSSDWDRAKPVRHWLLDSWIAWGWPPCGLLRALDGDRELFRRLVARMSRTKEGLQFLQRLGSEVKSYPELAKVWGTDVQRALANPYAPTDHD